jgi:hypothetical protein
MRINGTDGGRKILLSVDGALGRRYIPKQDLRRRDRQIDPEGRLEFTLAGPRSFYGLVIGCSQLQSLFAVCKLAAACLGGPSSQECATGLPLVASLASMPFSEPLADRSMFLTLRLRQQ